MGSSADDARVGSKFFCSLIIVGTFPPPWTGASNANAAVRDYFKSVGARAESIDTAPKTLDRRFSQRLGRLPKVVHAWIRIIQLRAPRRKHRCLLYLSAAGGPGLLYDLMTIVLSRILHIEIVVHHHNWTYLRKRSSLAYAVVTIAGQRARHVVLCAYMGQLLERLYRVTRWQVLSNQFLVKQEVRPRVRGKLRTIGFISNLTVEKGTNIVLDLARHVRNSEWEDVKIVIAGPCSDASLISKLKRAERDGLIEWRGPAYDNEKKKFWNDVDVFIFPSFYANEAEPIVLWEAMTSGCPVIAYDRGCISSQLDGHGLTIPVGDDFCTAAMRQLQKWRINPKELESDSRQVLDMTARARKVNEQDLRNLATVMGLL